MNKLKMQIENNISKLWDMTDLFEVYEGEQLDNLHKFMNELMQETRELQNELK